MDAYFCALLFFALYQYCCAQNSQNTNNVNNNIISSETINNNNGNFGQSNYGNQNGIFDNKNGGYGYKDGKHGYYDDFDFGGVTNGQNGSIIRPCPNMDTYCIRRYFGHHAKCKPVNGPIPEPYYRAQANYLYPTFNLSAVQIGNHYRGFQGVVEDFFLNNETDRAVLTIRFRNFRLNSTLDYYRYYRVGKEPAITKSVSALLFPSLTTTTIFRGIDNLKLARSESQSFVDAIPQVYIDPSAGENPDPVVQRTFAAFIAGILIAIQEAQLTDAAWIAGTYIQHDICDFGLELL